jgi:polyphosphate kinase
VTNVEPDPAAVAPATTKATAAGTPSSADAAPDPEIAAVVVEEPQTEAAAAAAAIAQENADLRDPSLFINRELSMLAFQARVLEEAWDKSNPLLERVKFLAILGSNLAEFFMVRIAALKQQVAAGIVERSADGLTPLETLTAAREQGFELMRRARACIDALLPEMAAAGVHVLSYDDLDDRQRAVAARYFDESVFPVLTPLAFDPGRPFPHISNLSLSLAVLIHDPRQPDGENAFARVKVPGTLPRLIPVGPPAGVAEPAAGSPPELYLLWLEQLMSAHLDRLFPGFEVIGCWPFRVTRDAETEIQEMEADDLLETIEEAVRKRRFGQVVRCSIVQGTPDFVREILVENLELDPADVIELKSPLGTSSLWDLVAVDRPDLKDQPFVPAVPAEFAEEADPFSVVRQHDVLLHRPYESFAPVLDMFRRAAWDPSALAIKSTLYRVGRNAPVVEALLEAGANGKEVAVLVELKARFDEEPNIEWARALEAEGVHVVYGLLGLKTHSKLALFVRREAGRIRRYVHVGTGNYNTVTAKLYTDLDYLTCDEEMGADASEAFNSLTGYATIPEFRKFMVAPRLLRPAMEELIEREIEHQKRDGNGHLIFKMNALVDKPFIRQLYRASRAGVRCDLLVRGICCLRPGIPGVSDNIQVTSIVGRFLEHSRIYWFHNGGQDEAYMGSADLMPRNLNRRVEIIFPVRDRAIVRRLREEILATYMRDTVKARRMHADGTYEHIAPADGEEPLNAMEWFIAYHQKKATAERGGKD